MSNLLTFTKEKLLKIAPPKSDKENIYRDEKGLILCVRDTGRKTFYFYKIIKNIPKRIKIGEFSLISIKEAREQFQEIKKELVFNLSVKKNNDKIVQKV